MDIWTSAMSPEEFTGDSAGKIICDSLETLVSKDIIPAQAALEHVHSMGLEFHAMIRMAVLGHTPPANHNIETLLARRPDLRMVTKDGAVIEKGSYAFEEVQQHMLSMIREIVKNFDVDGISLAFIRGPMFVGYEKPVIEDFKKKYGLDPRELDENDIRVQKLRAGYLTEFVRKTRKLLDELEIKKGKKLALTAWGFPVQSTLFYGLDLETLLDERLLDGITGTSWETKEFIESVQKRNCKFYYNKMVVPADDIIKSYEYGVDGFTSWDINLHYQELPEQWALMSRVGHKEEVKAFGKNPPRMKRTMLKTVGGVDVGHLTNVGAGKNGYSIPEMLIMYSGG